MPFKFVLWSSSLGLGRSGFLSLVGIAGGLESEYTTCSMVGVVRTLEDIIRHDKSSVCFPDSDTVSCEIG